jgi:cytochrome P450
MNITECTDPQALINFSQTPEGKLDENSIYRRLVEITPIFKDEDTGMWFITRWEDCSSLFQSENFIAPNLIHNDPRYDSSPTLQFLAKTLPFQNPPYHAKIRSQIQKTFSRPVLMKLNEFVGEVIDKAINSLADKGEFDVVEDYAAKIPSTVICNILGIPEGDHELFGGWLAQQFRVITPIPPPDEVLNEVDESTRQLVHYMSGLVEQRRAEPKADIISEMVRIQETMDDPITTEEIIVTATVLLAGGSDTTKMSISLGAKVLLEHREQMLRLVGVQDSTLERTCFEEILRIGGGVLWGNGRKALEDSVIAGQDIKAGEIVVPVLASANLDANKFEKPMQFKIDRHPNQHLAFGGGIHVCIGNMMARMIGGRAVMALVRAYPDMVLLDDKPDVRTDLVSLRNLNSLRVKK